MNRPNFHFTPQKGWINDPNGMVYIDGEYHIFYQYYPDDIIWGPMHWGHAVSRDLLHWEHKETALYPDELGYIFSGSCIYDKENVSGLGTEKNPPLLAFFTHHDPKNGRQQQSIAYSLDKEHFIKYENNPVIPNTEKKDFRDPKVFENPVKGGFTMALAAGECIEFYHSVNLLEWELTGSFQPGTGDADAAKAGLGNVEGVKTESVSGMVNGYGGICECPDCFPMETEDGTKWVLLISMCLSEEDVAKVAERGECASAHVMQYYIGEFDGDTFIDTVHAGEPLTFEFGTDDYAAVTFAHCPERILMGWGENWNYVRETPAGKDKREAAEAEFGRGEEAAPADEYRGKMTLARKLALVKTGVGYRLQSTPMGADTDFCIQQSPQMFHMQMEYGRECEVAFSNDLGEALIIRICPDEIIVDRSSCGVYKAVLSLASENESNQELISKAKDIQNKNYDILRAPRFAPEGSSMEVIYDEGYFEIFAEGGLAVFSVMTYPKQPLAYG